MASDNQGSKPPGTGRRPPTIDLTATEIASEQAASSSAQASAFASGEPRREEAHTSGAKSSAPSGPGLWARLTDRLPLDPKWPLIGTGVGVVAIALLASPWWTGTFASRPAADGDLAARLTRIEAQIRELSNRPVAPDTKAMGDVATRLGKIEAALASQTSADPAFAGRVTGAEATAKAAVDEIAALRGRLDEIASLARGAQSRADAAANAADAAQKSSQSTTAELARGVMADDRASRRAAVANALSNAVERGEPFVAEFTAAKALAADASSLAPLESFSPVGVISTAVLARELTALVPAMLRASSSASPNAGFLDKLQANAERLVRVRPVGNVSGDEPSSIIARIETKAAQGDIDAALSELAKLPPAIRAPADAWIKKAQQRQAAIAASRQFARDALAALGKPAL